MITDKFIHIHIPRTAGQFVRGKIKSRQKYWSFMIPDSHLTLQESKERLVKQNPNLEVPSFCVVRNPWDWYVSRYFFRQAEWRVNNKVSFSDIENFENNKEGFQKHMLFVDNLIKTNGKAKSLKSTGGVARIWLRLTLSDFYNDFTDNKVNHVGRFENLRPDLARILNALDPNAFPMNEVRQLLVGKVNTSSHVQYQHYYDDEKVKNLVHEWDGEYIERFGYEF